jgi:hypothetical protein
MEELKERMNIPKQRHGCVTAWLVLMIIANSVTALVYLFAGDTVAQNLPGEVSTTRLMLLALMGIGNVIFSVFLLKWKMLGFWGFIATSIGALILNISMGLSIGQSLFGLVGIAILFGVLQIKKDDVSAWDHLE